LRAADKYCFSAALEKPIEARTNNIGIKSSASEPVRNMDGCKIILVGTNLFYKYYFPNMFSPVPLEKRQ
jgi:hypothetical protein